jgi:cell shape-determining protein MreC
MANEENLTKEEWHKAHLFISPNVIQLQEQIKQLQSENERLKKLLNEIWLR